jgi:hypothetical protein
MKVGRSLGTIILIVLSLKSARSQDPGSFLLQADSIMSFEDSLSIFNLIDSLLLAQDQGSQFAIRVSYNSNVLSAGRTLGIENFGLSPGISYYHTSGLYADIAGFWSKDFKPEYYLTTLSVGYMYDFTKHFSVMADYDHYFYTETDDYTPYRNTISVTPFLEFKPVTFMTTYSFYFGDTHVHRIMPGISVRLQKKKWARLDRISLMPSAYVLFGNEVFSEIVYPYGLRETIFRINHDLPWYEIVDKNVFGIMNYTFSAPLTMVRKNWTLNLTYSYSIPKALPGETLTYSESSFLSGSLSYFIGLKRNKLSL